ncbi:hypothetical protein PC116_g26594 [Phytophthora cactorum]|nr:hypothetical protein Pcac1_g1840 [Phytophthora cactorum]KAG4224967.1 hypothetical protein PC116_g26594 [Phytophthora cactorum]
MKGGASQVTGRDAARTSTRMVTIGERSVSFEDSEDEDSRATDEDLGYGDDREESTPPTEAKAEPREEAVLLAGSRGVARPLSRNLADELSAVAGPDAADDDWGEEEKEDEPSSKAVRDSDGLAVRPPVNGDTPAANKVLARCFEKMQSSDWIRQFNPRQTRQATWGNLRDELAYPVNSLSTTQVAEDTVSLLQAMGMDFRNYPSTLTLNPFHLECKRLQPLHRVVTLVATSAEEFDAVQRYVRRQLEPWYRSRT